MHRASSWLAAGLTTVAALVAIVFSPAAPRAQLADASALPASTLRQIEAILADKARRTPTEQKIGSSLLRELHTRRGNSIAGAPALRRSVAVSVDGRVEVDIQAAVTADILARIGEAGGSVVASVPRYQAIRARVPLDAIESLAALDEIRFIAPAVTSLTSGSRTDSRRDVTTLKVDTSAGDIAHRAALARQFYLVDGTGIGIGVVSDGVDTISARQASGDLPAVTILASQQGTGDRGTALLEIVHDLAPGAHLFFATSGSGPAQFAANIQALCTAGARVIVGDAVYDNEAVFQDGAVAQAVNTATANGCFYFAAAGDFGNKTDGTSGVWEGDFVPSTPLGTFGTTHNFGGANFNQITQDVGQVFSLQWSDAWGQSANDYDLFLVDSAMQVIESSTNPQTGLHNPYESIVTDFVETNRRLVVVRFTGAARYLHLAVHGGRLALSTPGRIAGHSAAKNAFAVGAVDVAVAQGGAFPAGPLVPVTSYSSDGPRRIFYHPDGNAITPGNFSSTGGELVPKPDVAAADCVSTATPGFRPFCGTVAAAAHAAAIAALMLHIDPTLTRSALAAAMTARALDIEAAGPDRDSGAGIVDALGAVGRTHPPFADNPLVARSTFVRSYHVTQLRARVNALRVRCGLAPATFTDGTLTPSATFIKAAHIVELRTALNGAYTACGTSVPAYTDPALAVGATAIKAAHINELRAAVVALE
jgi:hypothetical protein